MQPSISIIVPVFNTERFLERCIESLLKQTIEDLEIILVDDGSEDKSSQICDEYLKKDRRIKVIHKKNEGLGLARNSGMKIARGEYITFVDSDDYVEKNIYQLMLKKIKKTDSDTCFCYFSRKNNANKIIDDTLQDNYLLFENVNNFILDMVGAPPNNYKDTIFDMSVCKGLFSNEIIKKHNIQFVSERKLICEDLIFEIDYLKYSKRVCIEKKPLYIYCENDGSLTHKYYSNRLSKEKELYSVIDKKLNKLFAREEYVNRLNRFFLGRCRICILNEIQYTNSKYYEKCNKINSIIQDPLLIKILKTYPYWENPIRQRIFNFFIKHKMVIIIYILSLLQIKYKQSIAN